MILSIGYRRPFPGVRRGWGVTLTTHPSSAEVVNPPSTYMACSGAPLLLFS
ncbi:hypothetical protein L798_00923 [Zootermopsis nevadensis]|uniref:Uncharacterized protein n=1 Tax=Zootermopsis nevadensis TaxID=136037 RepID=A0A067QJR6_ZOONE|nr:hypothetical protein L798_00923 [Zootermopsis nevadensis]